jgi:DNA-directed RNA polymerase alpha subunit
MEITKEQALQAIEILEQYKSQWVDSLRQIEKDDDRRDISILRLPTRTYNSLIGADIRTVGELTSIDQRSLIRFRCMGRKGIVAINEAMKSNGIDKEPFALLY